jgi:putative oxidoreductase
LNSGKKTDMSIPGRVARPLLASIFIVGGVDAMLDPEGKVKAAEQVTRPLAEHISALPDDTALLVRINGGVQVAAAVLLYLGKFRRLAALTLIGSIIPTTYVGHQFWVELDEEKRAEQRIHFLKNLGLLGGLMLAAFDTEGAPSVSWRIRRQIKRTRKNGQSRTQAAGGSTKRALDSMWETGSRAWRGAEEFAEKEATKGAEVASQYLHSGVERAAGLLWTQQRSDAVH